MTKTKMVDDRDGSSDDGSGILHFPYGFQDQENNLFNMDLNNMRTDKDHDLPLLEKYLKREEENDRDTSSSLFYNSNFQPPDTLVLPFAQNPFTSPLSVEQHQAYSPSASTSTGYHSNFSTASSPAGSIAYSPYHDHNKSGVAMEAQINNIPQQKHSHGIINNFPVELEYMRFPDKLYKTQKRVRGKSEQRIQKSAVEFALDFLDPVTLNLALVQSIQIYVKRSREVKNSAKYVGPIQLKAKSITLLEGTCKYLIKVDMDSVYEVEGKKVYHLHKTSTEELNLFHLIINISLADGRQRTLKTRQFLLIGKKTKPEPHLLSKAKSSPLNGMVRSRHDSFESPSVSSSGYGTTSGDEDVLRASTIVADHIKTKSLEIGDLIISNTIQTHHGDIAYHFPLQDADEFFKEGEIVGFYQDPAENKMKITKLTSRTASQASLKGVITRSQYLEAMKPKDSKVATETVCMLGIVPVKVMGTVKANDPLYASKTEPGIAVSGFHPQCQNINDDSLIGYAFESFKAQSEYEIGFVQAGVSVLNSASHILLNKHIQRLEQHWDKRIQNLTKTNAKFKRCFISSGLILLFTLVCVGIFLWQLFTPGSAYRYYKCKQGALPGRKATFSYNPDRISFTWVDVHGIQFKFRDLMEKTEHDQYKQMVFDKNAKYYLNVDYCAYGGTRSTKDVGSGQKVVYGPEVFAANSKCTKGFYYNEWQAKWNQLYSMTFVSYTKSQRNPINITCT